MLTVVVLYMECWHISNKMIKLLNIAIAVDVDCMYDLVISVRVLLLSHNSSMNYI